ncbi:hypothetical protein R5R35_006226 [Gryllus longicercus]|uniref:Uncharacterized protein n=1 Tax=Gryllus longicercus TaxID=2509291 RepID=A0AAN9VZ12_9ORTH
MESDTKQRNQRNRRRERAQRMQAQRESKGRGDGDSGEDESPAREKPPRPPNRRKKSKEPAFEEDIIDGFAILAFRTYEDLEVRTCIVLPPASLALFYVLCVRGKKYIRVPRVSCCSEKNIPPS